jgi:hypothetical protein
MGCGREKVLMIVMDMSTPCIRTGILILESMPIQVCTHNIVREGGGEESKTLPGEAGLSGRATNASSAQAGRLGF